MINTPAWASYIEHISVSQIREWCRNPRRWLMTKALKLPTTYSPATEIGSMVHKAIEEFLQGMPNTQEHALAEHCLKALLGCGRFMDQIAEGDFEVEKSIWHRYDEKYPPIYGFIDLIIWDYYKGCPIIVDHKTSKTKKYFKSARALKTDKQMVAYAHWALQQVDDSVPGVFVQHNQFSYGNKLDVLNVKTTFLCRRRIEREFSKIYGIIDMMMRDLVKFSTQGLPAPTKCKECNCRFGPDSCEFAPICNGVIDEAGYIETYERLKDDEGNVSSWDLRDALKYLDRPFGDLTKKSELDIIKVQGENVMRCIYLEVLVGKARQQVTHLHNTWDRREAVTKAVVAHVREHSAKTGGDCVAVAPSHFIGGAIDPDYMPIITQLKESEIKVVIEL